MDIRAKLLFLMERQGLGQTEMAKVIGVSQSTICRVVERGYTRQSKARKLIESYVEENASQLHIERIPSEVSAAVIRVWDKTPTHARLLARVIRSLNGLVPKLTKEGDGRYNDEN